MTTRRMPQRSGHAALAIIAPICAALGVSVDELATDTDGRPCTASYVVVARAQSVGALVRAGWTVAQAARVLDISPRNAVQLVVMHEARFGAIARARKARAA